MLLRKSLGQHGKEQGNQERSPAVRDTVSGNSRGSLGRICTRVKQKEQQLKARKGLNP